MQRIHSKSLPAIDDDDAEGMPMQQRQVPAAGLPPPTTSAPRSAFELARAQAKAASARAPLPEITIRKGVPLPPDLRRRATNTLQSVVESMEVGDSVELPIKAAKSLIRTAGKFGPSCTPRRQFVYRKLSATTGGVWRTA